MTQAPRILLVDDLPANIYTLSRALAEDYQILIATSGADALQTAEQQQPDLILLDVMMPEMDGLEALRRLRRSDWGRQIPVILVTADDRTQTQVDGLDLGADDFIAKPVVVPVVQARVRNVLERQCLQRELIRLATQDALTDLLNRRCFFDKGEEELRRVGRYQHACGLIMLDLDHFKAINDQYGHAIGDLALQAFSRILTAIVRAGDLAGRIGGEEFGVLLPHTDESGTRVLAERIRLAVSRCAIPVEGGSNVVLTTSAGVTQLLASDSRFEKALQRADAALYNAKAEGRNRVRGFAEPEKLME
ncbi:diguanylate cyclase [Wenzhouxiangella limi]|uniref:diguanylate cyclase n=1 Tax=Wenzhouxiangella limi TaxID=2707351 RepID=A0A845V130_9GAMM|nr:diguanylate cyclase [Wenzhouxiangella limi]NDY96778.1 diguanylate cyclase [Wenzhouxiangella limi]